MLGEDYIVMFGNYHGMKAICCFERTGMGKVQGVFHFTQTLALKAGEDSPGYAALATLSSASPERGA
jgi:hypothetical protein